MSLNYFRDHLESIWYHSEPSEDTYSSNQYTEVRFASFHSGGFTTMAIINPPKMKLAKRTSVHQNGFFHGRSEQISKQNTIVRNDMHCVSFCWFYCSLASKKPVRLFMGQQKFTLGYFKFPIKHRYGIIVQVVVHFHTVHS